MKWCARCESEKPTDQFYKNRSRPDGLSGYCAECKKELARKYQRTPAGREVQRRAGRRYRNSERYREWRAEYTRSEAYKQRKREYWQTETFKRAHREASERYRERHPEKVGAQQAVWAAIQRGELEPVENHKCTDCGGDAEHYHHESYEEKDWLDVVPLCVDCHRQRHEE